MKTTPKSKLLGKTLIFVGFCFKQHIIKPDFFLQITVYKYSKKKFVLCVSEGRKPGNIEGAAAELGLPVLGDDIYPFAQRFIEGADFNKVKEILTDEADWHWSQNEY